MNAKISSVAIAAALLGLAACHKAESPSEVQHDVAAASQDAAKDTTKAMNEQANTVADANQDVAKAEQKADEKKADSAADVAVTQAEGDHKVAIEKCEALSGKAQKACKDKADAELAMAKADAKAMEAAHQQ